MNPESAEHDGSASALGATFQTAFACHQVGNLAEAGRLYRSILETQPDHADANHNLGVIFVQSKQPAMALRYLRSALLAKLDREQYWVSYAAALLQTGDRDVARAVMEQGVRQGIEGQATRLLLARLRSGVRAAVDEPPANSRSAHTAGSDLSRQARAASARYGGVLAGLFSKAHYFEAVAFAADLTRRYPDEGLGWKGLGVALRNMGRPSEALEPMRRASVLMPNDCDTWNELGLDLHQLGQLDAAVASYRRALRIRPNYADAHKNLGNALRHQGLLEDALASYRNALRANPNDAAAYNNQGNVLREIGRLAEALSSYQRAVELNPASPEIHNNLGKALWEAGQLGPAAECYRRALRVRPDYGDAYRSLGKVLMSQGQFDEALACFRQLESLHPGDPSTRHLIASLTGHTTERAPLEYVEDMFDNYAATFDRHLGEVLKYDVPERLRGLVTRWLPRSVDGPRVLDLGCGTGLMGQAMAPHAKYMVGVDISEKMLQRAQARNVYHRLERLDLVTMMRNESAASYDVVLATDVFIYLGRLDDVGSEAARLLGPGGILAFSVETLDVPPQGESSGDVAPGYHLEKSGRYSHSIPYLTMLASANGFRVLEMSSGPIRTENRKPVQGHLVVWQNTDPGPAADA